MIAGIETLTLVLCAGVGLVGLGIGLMSGWWYRGYSQDAARFEDAILDKPMGAGHEVVLDAPEISSSIWDIWKQSRHRAREQKLAKRGYVKWYKLDGMLQAPTWVKPKREGAGVPEYYDGDVTYFFPPDALATDARTGAPVAVHHDGEVEPVNIVDPEVPPIEGDRLQEVINLEAESDPPGWLAGFDLDATTIMWIMIVALIVIGGAQQFLA